MPRTVNTYACMGIYQLMPSLIQRSLINSFTTPGQGAEDEACRPPRLYSPVNYLRKCSGGIISEDSRRRASLICFINRNAEHRILKQNRLKPRQVQRHVFWCSGGLSVIRKVGDRLRQGDTTAQEILSMHLEKVKVYDIILSGFWVSFHRFWWLTRQLEASFHIK